MIWLGTLVSEESLQYYPEFKRLLDALYTPSEVLLVSGTHSVKSIDCCSMNEIWKKPIDQSMTSANAKQIIGTKFALIVERSE